MVNVAERLRNLIVVQDNADSNSVVHPIWAFGLVSCHGGARRRARLLTCYNPPMSFEDLIEAFKRTPAARRCQTSSGSFGICTHVAVRFWHFAVLRGFKATMWHVAGLRSLPADAHPKWRDLCASGSNVLDFLVHTVVEVDGVCVDWTARQFFGDAPWPELLSPRQLRHRWRRAKRVKRRQIGSTFNWPLPRKL